MKIKDISILYNVSESRRWGRYYQHILSVGNVGFQTANNFNNIILKAKQLHQLGFGVNDLLHYIEEKAELKLSLTIKTYLIKHNFSINIFYHHGIITARGSHYHVADKKVSRFRKSETTTKKEPKPQPYKRKDKHSCRSNYDYEWCTRHKYIIDKINKKEAQLEIEEYLSTAQL